MGRNGIFLPQGILFRRLGVIVSFEDLTLQMERVE
jgi:hypothetical protein